MKKRVFVIAAIVSGALAVSGCTTNPYTGEREAGKSGIGAGIGSLVGAGIGALSSSKKDRGKGALIGAAAGAALGGGVGYYMDVQEAKLRDKMRGTGVSVTRSGDNIILNMPNNVTFDSSSATLKPAGANTLTGVAMVLKEYPKTAVNVVGYTDSGKIGWSIIAKRVNNKPVPVGACRAYLLIYGESHEAVHHSLQNPA